MILHILRGIFVLLMAAAGWMYLAQETSVHSDYSWLALSITLTAGVFFICLDILSPRKKVLIFSGVFLGLMVGMIITYALSFVVQFLVDLFVTRGSTVAVESLITFINIVIGIVACYLSISFILQTKDDFRFIIPYVEFSKQVRGGRPIVVDTSVLIDGRIIDIGKTGFLDSRLIVPRFVLNELQMVADSGDRLKRARGKRGLDMLTQLQDNKKLEVIVYDWSGQPNGAAATDEKLLTLSKELNARLLSNDVNLKRVGEVRDVQVINLNELASALRPVVLPGEKMSVRLVKQGEDPSQGVGFLEDGTMVVVKEARSHIGEETEFTVTNVLQTQTGRMIFGQIGEGAMAGGGAKRPRIRQG